MDLSISRAVLVAFAMFLAAAALAATVPATASGLR